VSIAIFGQGRRRSGTVTRTSAPARETTKVGVSPQRYPASTRLSVSRLSTGVPSIEAMTSPTCSPAAAAGVSFSTSMIARRPPSAARVDAPSDGQ